MVIPPLNWNQSFIASKKIEFRDDTYVSSVITIH
jgi:hypothetical protein